MISHTTTTIWRVRLVHAELGARVVEASCEEGGQLLAMAFGEATTAEVAEDRARRRAAQLLEAHHAPPPLSGEPAVSEEAPSEGVKKDAPEPPAATLQPETETETETARDDFPGRDQPAVSPPPAAPPPQQSPPRPGPSEPEDWSEDLAAVEVEMEKLGWNREQESVYLERCFGLMERSSITRYQDLRLYIDALQALSPPADPCTAPLPAQPQQPPPPPPPSRELLIREGNTLLRQLGWTTQQGRVFLKRHFGHTSRQALSDEQLMQFNQQLEALLASGGGHDSSPS